MYENFARILHSSSNHHTEDDKGQIEDKEIKEENTSTSHEQRF